MVQLNDEALALTSLGAAGVISGVVIKNSMEQLSKKNSVLAKFVGPAIFVGGWLLVLWAVIRGDVGLNATTIQASLAVAMIIGVVMYMKDKMSKKEKIEWYIGLLFPLGWILLAYTIGLGGFDNITNLSIDQVLDIKPILSFSSAAVILISMLWALPWQRKNCIVDGPGMPLFCLGWALLIGANSI